MALRRPVGAVAVDLGATSGRFAAGWVEDGQIRFEVVEQVPHSPLVSGGHEVWDLEKLLGLCRRAVAFAGERFERSAVGIDAWGVDHGFLDDSGALFHAPICYRDKSHSVQFSRFEDSRAKLFGLTGIAAQPFNTIYQLAARKAEGMTPCRWLPLPDLLGYLLGGQANVELTEASTTGLLGLDGAWCDEAFELVGWPIPSLLPRLPADSGLEELGSGVSLARVGSHDTASAVYGLGPLDEGTMYLNVGTWALAGVVLDSPLATAQAEAAGFTNERAVDGRIRFLKNVPGFYVVNRLHEELGVGVSVPEWLSSASPATATLDLLDQALYAPESMVAAVRGLGSDPGTDLRAWAGLALGSLAATISAQIGLLEGLIGRSVTTIRVSGGGSQSAALCQALASASGRAVVAGPAEATVLGNLAASLKALGAGPFELSAETVKYAP